MVNVRTGGKCNLNVVSPQAHAGCIIQIQGTTPAVPECKVDHPFEAQTARLERTWCCFARCMSVATFGAARDIIVDDKAAQSAGGREG